MSTLASVPIPEHEQVAAATGWSRRTIWSAVAVILLLEVLLFCWSFGKFFCGDSVFYLWYRVETPAQVLRVLTRPDHLHNYRPLTYIAFSFLLFPLFQLHPLGYHFVTLGTHLLASLLAFGLLRQFVRAPAAALGGMLWFGVHAVNFYITYDASFLPDYMHGLFCIFALLAYAFYRQRGKPGWLAASLASFLLALLSKESAVVLPVGVVAVELLLRRAATQGGGRQEPGGGKQGLLPASRVLPPASGRFVAIAAFFGMSVLYVAWTLHVKGGEIYPAGGASEPYALTLNSAVLALKLRYLAWLANLPTQFARRGWLVYAALVAMVPALAWIGALLARTARQLWRELLACAVWAVIGLSPVLFIRQLPMKHNLYLPVLACAAGLAIVLDKAVGSKQEAVGRTQQAGRRASSLPPPASCLPPPVSRFPAWAALAALGVVASTAFQLPGDLKYSWVGEASDIAQNSLQMMRREHPTLPLGALLYVLPTQVKGVSSWYLENGALFNLFYGDSSLRTRFADLGSTLPPDFASRPDVLIFRLHDRQLWDVTREYKRDAADRGSYRLLEHFAQARTEARLRWAPAALPEGKHVAVLRPFGRDGQSRLALVELPGSSVHFDLPPVPPDSVLQLGVSSAGPLKSFARGRVFFTDSRGTEQLVSVTLDAVPDSEHWWDWEIDLKNLAGRQGTLMLETERDQDDDWMLWSRMRIVPRSNPLYQELAADVDERQVPRKHRLIETFDRAQIVFDRSEFYPDYSHFATPTGKPAFLHPAREVEPPHYALVTIAGASVRYALDPLPPGSALELAAANVSRIGDGLSGTVYVEAQGRRQRIFQALLPPGAKQWVDRTISLDEWAGLPIVLVFQASSGPRGNTIGDWCAWGRLRIVQK